jgi:hypothetical protein
VVVVFRESPFAVDVFPRQGQLLGHFVHTVVADSEDVTAARPMKHKMPLLSGWCWFASAVLIVRPFLSKKT